MPNGELKDLNKLISQNNIKVSLHINLVEGYPLSEKKDVNLLITDDGSFKYSFIGLFFLSLSNKRKELEKHLYKEIQNQVVPALYS